MTLVRASDGAVHFSDLKKFALSPAHYKAACEEPFESSRAMRVGTIVHQLVLGPRKGHELAVYEGKTRQGKAWEEFAAEHDGKEIVSRAEWSDAVPVAEAVLRDPIAQDIMLAARFEVPLRWTDAGIECATSGVDVLGLALADLKTTTIAEPIRFQRHALSMYYPEQLAFYGIGAEILGIDVPRGLHLIAVEVNPPHAVTVFKLTDELVQNARKTVVRWLERLRLCEEADHWPAYAQTVVPFALPAWAEAEDLAGFEDDEPAAGAA